MVYVFIQIDKMVQLDFSREVVLIIWRGSISFYFRIHFRSVLDANEHYQKVGDARAEADIDCCMSRADVSRCLEYKKYNVIGWK